MARVQVLRFDLLPFLARDASFRFLSAQWNETVDHYTQFLAETMKEAVRDHTPVGVGYRAYGGKGTSSVKNLRTKPLRDSYDIVYQTTGVGPYGNAQATYTLTTTKRYYRAVVDGRKVSIPHRTSLRFVAYKRTREGQRFVSRLHATERGSLVFARQTGPTQGDDFVGRAVARSGPQTERVVRELGQAMSDQWSGRIRFSRTRGVGRSRRVFKNRGLRAR